MRLPRAREAVAAVVGSCVLVKLARRLLNRMERWARLHARVDGVTAVSAAQLGLPVDRTPYPAPWNDHPWDQPGWYGERAATSTFRVNGMRFVGPREWVDQIRAEHGADTPEAN